MNTELRALQLKAKHQVYTLLSGNHLSKLYGEGYDFAELREYQMGDDIRKINWTITAKLGKAYIKELHANRELLVVVASFMDGSVYVGKDNSKQKKITEISTILGYASQQNSDLFTGICFTPQKTISSPPTKHIYHIEEFSASLFNSTLLHTKLDYQQSIQTLFKRLTKPSLLFIISDFLEDMDLSLLSQKHEIIAIIVRDKKEEIPEKQAEVTLEDPRDGARLNTHLSTRSIKTYQTRLKAHDEQQKEIFSRYSIRFIKIFTDEDPIGKLLQLFR